MVVRPYSADLAAAAILLSSRQKCCCPCYWKPVDGTTVATATGAAPACGAALVSTTVATAGVAPPAAGSTATAVATRLFCGYATGTAACSAGCARAQSVVRPRTLSPQACDARNAVRTCVTYTVDGSLGSTNAAWTKVPAATACVNSDATGVAACAPQQNWRVSAQPRSRGGDCALEAKAAWLYRLG